VAVGDLYRVVNKYTWFAPAGGGDNEECQNVYHYRQTSGSDVQAADSCLSAWLAVVADILIDVAPVHVSFTETSVVDPNDTSDYAVFVGISPGLRAAGGAAAASPENNISMYNPRPFPGTRQARKSYPFLFRNELIGKNIDFEINGLDALMPTLRGALGVTIVSGGNAFMPCVVRESFPGTFTHVWDTQTWFNKPWIGTQDTRRK